MRRVRILRQVQNLTRISYVASPHGSEIARGVANWVGDEHFEFDCVAEGQLERTLQNRAKVRTEARVGLYRFDRGAANLEGHETSGMDDLFGKIDLEMAHHFAAAFAPTLKRGKSGVLK